MSFSLSEGVKAEDVNLRWPLCGLTGSLDAGAVSTIALLPKLRPTPTGERSEIDRLTIRLKAKPDVQKIAKLEEERKRLEEEAFQRRQSSQGATENSQGGKYAEQLAQMTAMGFDRDLCLSILEQTNGNVDQALNFLM